MLFSKELSSKERENNRESNLKCIAYTVGMTRCTNGHIIMNRLVLWWWWIIFHVVQISSRSYHWAESIREANNRNSNSQRCLHSPKVYHASRWNATSDSAAASEKGSWQVSPSGGCRSDTLVEAKKGLQPQAPPFEPTLGNINLEYYLLPVSLFPGASLSCHEQLSVR